MTCASFPQGHHTAPEHERQLVPAASFHTGVALLAAALDAAVVPFGLAGTEKVLVQHPGGAGKLKVGGLSFSLDRGPLAIAFGPPLRLAPGESPRHFTARLQSVCFDLTREAEEALGR